MKFVQEKTKLVLNSIMDPYFNLGHNNTAIKSNLKQSPIKYFRTNLVVFKTSFLLQDLLPSYCIQIGKLEHCVLL